MYVYAIVLLKLSANSLVLKINGSKFITTQTTQIILGRVFLLAIHDAYASRIKE